MAIFASALCCFAQTTDESMKFEVVSVRKSPEMMPFSSSYPLDGSAGPPLQGLFRANAPIQAYLLFAYGVNEPGQARAFFDSLPVSWRLQRFTIEARAAGEPSRDQVRVMMQNLLKERFGLVLKKETKVRPEYVYSLRQPNMLGPHLRKHPADQPCTINPNESIVTIAPPKDDSAMPTTCGQVRWNVGTETHVHIVGQPLSVIVAILAGLQLSDGDFTPHSSVDATSLEGLYDADIQYGPRAVDGEMLLDASGPSAHDAIRDQIGLKIEERKRPVELLMIQHIEEPSVDQ